MLLSDIQEQGCSDARKHRGDEDLINPEEKGNLEYRKQQLKRLQDGSYQAWIAAKD